MLVDDTKKEVIVLKLHGSIDWFDRTSYSQLEENRMKQGLPTGGSDLVFQDRQRFGAVPLLEGPRFPDDPLRRCTVYGKLNTSTRAGLFFWQPLRYSILLP
jgi:hypothetical protein